MNFRQVEVFHAVYVSGSITAAAQTLHISQPAVSKILRHTEDRLGFALFRRVKDRLAPTEEAQQLFNEVAEVYQRLGSLKLTAKNLRAAGTGHLRLAVSPALGLGITPAAIAQFRTENPRATFDVKTIDHADMVRSLYERESDLAVGFVVPSHPRLKSVQIGSAELVLLHDKVSLAGGPVPLCADESCQTSESLASLKGKYQYVNIKLDKTGGVTEGLCLAQAALEMKFKLMVGCMAGSSRSMAPAFVVGQLCDVVDLDGPLLAKSDVPNAIRYQGTRMFAPEADLWG